MARGPGTGNRDEFAELLKTIRAGRPQDVVGSAAAPFNDGRTLSQSKISRAEQGRIPLSPDEADAYARGCGATPEQRRRLVALARETQARRATSRAALMRDWVQIQRRTLELERGSGLVRSWQDSLVIGTVQTRAYTLAMAGQELSDEWWAQREARVALLDDEARTWHLVMSEAALRWNLGSEVMAAQAEHLVTVSERPNVTLGVVLLGPERQDATPRPFHIYGRHMAVVATDAGTAFLDDQADVEHYGAVFERVEPLAIYGDELRTWLAALAAHYRT